MPILEISDGKGHLCFPAREGILAVMAYPDDETKRTGWFAAYLANLYHEVWTHSQDKEERASLSRFHVIIPDLWKLHQPPEPIWKQGVDRVRRGVLAGEILKFQLSCAVHHRQFTDRFRAVEALAELLSDVPTVGGGKLPASERTLNRVWPLMANAAHLLAAYSELADDALDQLADPSYHPDRITAHAEVLLEDEAVLRFLAVAERFRTAGEKYCLLDPKNTWACPGDLVLPDVPFQIPPLGDEILDWFDKGSPIHH